jgi:antitoxin component of MazEF toxin-antitoxin module
MLMLNDCCAAVRVRLPLALAEELGISEGDELEVRPSQRKTSYTKPVVAGGADVDTDHQSSLRKVVF